MCYWEKPAVWDQRSAAEKRCQLFNYNCCLHRVFLPFWDRIFHLRKFWVKELQQSTARIHRRALLPYKSSVVLYAGVHVCLIMWPCSSACAFDHLAMLECMCIWSHVRSIIWPCWSMYAFDHVVMLECMRIWSCGHAGACVRLIMW